VPDSLGFWNDRPPVIPSQSCALRYFKPKIKTSGAGVKRHELCAMTVPRRGTKVLVQIDRFTRPGGGNHRQFREPHADVRGCGVKLPDLVSDTESEDSGRDRPYAKLQEWPGYGINPD
jgi:hypothetical protein